LSWLGAVDRRGYRCARGGGIATFYTPEHAVEAFSFLAYRHQEWLLESRRCPSRSRSR
jgi:hypothetical protein